MSIEEASKQHISKLQSVIENSYQCRATHRRTVTTRASRDPNWPVEVFWLSGHPVAKRCFAWADPIRPSQIFAVLDIPPVIGAATAIQSALACHPDRSLPQSDGEVG